ncbi:hypothetical protein ACFYU8_24455 [Brevibacillus sp. NPDC003359]|uniref:hypothetical protein n=1 Tax=unclassified Brevibacillus TaxID=2684853 RepID=UPI00367CEB0D
MPIHTIRVPERLSYMLACWHVHLELLEEMLKGKHPNGRGTAGNSCGKSTRISWVSQHKEKPPVIRAV